MPTFQRFATIQTISQRMQARLKWAERNLSPWCLETGRIKRALAKDYNCANIFDEKGDSQGFCWGNLIGEVKDEYFTITSVKEPKGEGKNSLEYLSFKLIKGKFYLHQFSKQLLDDELDEVGEPFIFYRALLDENDKKHKIKLEAVNDALLQDFVRKYEEKNFKEIDDEPSLIEK